MKIELYCAGHCRNHGKSNQLSGCGIMLKYIDDHYICMREMYFGLGGSSRESANLKAIRLALSSIKPSYRSTEVIVHTPFKRSLQHAKKEFADDHTPADEMRRWLSYYNNVSLMIDKNSENIQRVRKLAEEATDAQDTYDSGTTINDGHPDDPNR